MTFGTKAEATFANVYPYMPKCIALFISNWFSADSPLARVGRGTIWVSIGLGATHLFGIASAICVARILGTNDYGHLSILRSSMEMISVFSGMALGATASRYVSLYRSTESVKAAQIIGTTTVLAWFTSALGALILLVFAKEMALVLNDSGLVVEIRLTAALLFFATLTGGYSGILNGLECFKVQGTIRSITSVVAFPLIVGGVLWAGVSGGIVALACTSALSLLLSTRAVKRITRQMNMVPTFRCDRELVRILGLFTLPALLSAAIMTPATWFGNVMLVNSQNGYSEMGIFTAANHWRNALVILPNIIGNVAIPILSNLHGTKDHKGYIAIVFTNFKVIAAITIVPAIILGTMSPLILHMYGAGFQSGTSAIMWLLAAGVLYSMSTVLGQVLTSLGKMWVGLGLNVCWAGVFLVSTWHLIPYGAAGLAAAYAMSYATHLTLSAAVGWVILKRSNRRNRLPLTNVIGAKQLFQRWWRREDVS